ncbi:Mu transposase C-terminal domain-containing protein [Nocardia gipuzkoensis]|uniref:Mu transposase C-terminal domain-containing protein n=1 Tax=Nocardia gipuzkoensis TaxID=2749991 RepID=UPI00237D37BD|nr:Mu transposase C-terminal domain-containing protein [Nocardia gipuzkoensis]MDE1672672.1 Mu transposase C-terminal domain-containing protein [Nocardia gipuzkoensis]
MSEWRSILRPGDWVHFEGAEHQVVAIAGSSVRLRCAEGTPMVILASHLMAAPDFGVVDGAPPPEVPVFGLLDALPAPVLAAAKEWEAHIVEATLGTGPDGSVRPEYDPATRTQTERFRAKVEELTAAGRPIGFRTLQRMRTRYAEQGLWGLVDQRVLRETTVVGRVDERVVAAVRQELDAQTDVSTGTRSRVIRRVSKALEEEHGPDVVPLPGRSTFYALIEALSTGRHSFGSAVTRRQAANRPARPFTPTFAARPGEQVQIDSTPLDVMVVLEPGVVARADLTIVVDVATRTICAAVLRPVGTKAVDASLLLARMLVPEPMRPGWAAALAMSASRLPHGRLMSIDERMSRAAAKPVIVPDTITIDGGNVFVSETFTRACERLGISIQRARKRTPTDKAIVEATFGSINTLWSQHLAGYTGANTGRRGERVEEQAVWTIPELQDLLEEWVIAGWQPRPHDSLRDPDFPRRALSPNDAYAAMVAVAGYLPVTLTGEDYLELLPVTWRAINDYGIRVDYRTYDAKALEPHRRQPSGIAAKKNLWEVHYDPYDLSQVFVRTPGGWVTAEWTHKPMVSAPFADFTWREARRLVARRGADDTDETAIARALDDLLIRSENGPARPDERATRRAAARGRVAAATHRPPASDTEPVEPPPVEPVEATVIPFGIFDAAAEAEKWR